VTLGNWGIFAVIAFAFVVIGMFGQIQSPPINIGPAPKWARILSVLLGLLIFTYIGVLFRDESVRQAAGITPTPPNAIAPSTTPGQLQAIGLSTSTPASTQTSSPAILTPPEPVATATSSPIAPSGVDATPETTPTLQSSSTVDSSLTPKINVTFPMAGATVPRIFSVMGMVSRLPPDTLLWFYVYAQDAKQYFFVKIVDINQGIWLAKDVYVGEDKKENGQPYEIGVLMIPSSKQQTIQDGITDLPEGAQKVAQLTVYRE
jgi:hypothetical protein